MTVAMTLWVGGWIVCVCVCVFRGKKTAILNRLRKKKKEALLFILAA